MEVANEIEGEPGREREEFVETDRDRWLNNG